MLQFDAALLGIVITIILTLIAFAFGYGVLTQKVKANRADIEEEKKKYDRIDSKLDNISERLSGVETQMNGMCSTKRKI